MLMEPSHPMLLSVIVPTFRRPDALGRCLLALAQQSYATMHFEVIVVNDGGPMLDAAALSRLLPKVKLLQQPNAGPGAARNTGAAAASHDWLAFTDDDCEPEACWIANLVQALEQHPKALIGGHTFNALTTNPYATASQCVIDALCRWLNPNPMNGQFVPSNNFACSKEHYLAIGGFDPAYQTGEDRDLCHRWRQSGGLVIQLPGAPVAHAHHLTHHSFWNQHRLYGQGSWKFHLSLQQQGAPMPKAGWLFLSILFRQVVRQSRRQLIPLVMLLVLETQLAVLVGNQDMRCRYRQPRT